MNFQYPWLLLLLIILIPLFRRRMSLSPPSLKVSSLKHFTGKEGQNHRPINRFFIPSLLELIALALIIVAMARPRTGVEKNYSYRDGIDIVISLDISGSMNNYDQPGNIPAEASQVAKAINSKALLPRIDTAKSAIDEFIKKRPGDRLGLVVFASEAFSVCPPTSDHEYLHNRLKNIDTNYLGQFNRSTNITAAISGGLARLRKSKAKKKVMILVTDGSHSAQTNLTPRMAAEAASQSGAQIYTIGVGDKVAWAEEEGFFRGRTLVQRNQEFDDALLKEIASKTKGQYFHAKHPEDLEKVLDEIDKIETVKIKEYKNTNYAEHYYYFIYAALACLCLSLILSHSLLMRYP